MRLTFVLLKIGRLLVEKKTKIVTKSKSILTKFGKFCETKIFDKWKKIDKNKMEKETNREFIYSNEVLLIQDSTHSIHKNRFK